MSETDLKPYSPGSEFETTSKQMAENNREIGTVRAQAETLRAAGLLDEETELSLTERIESLRTDNTRALAQLSEGREVLIPGLTPRRSK